MANARITVTAPGGGFAFDESAPDDAQAPVFRAAMGVAAMQAWESEYPAEVTIQTPGIPATTIRVTVDTD